jgi:hypothetical protein
VGVAEYVDGVDRLLTRAHGLFPAGGDGGEAIPAGGGGASVPGTPAGESGLTAGAGVAGGVYQQTQPVVAGLDAAAGEAAAEAAAIGAQGHLGSGVIRDQARTEAAAIAPMANSAAGMRLMVSTMDSHVTAMQNQLSITDAQNQALTMQLRQVAASYRAQGRVVNGGQPGGGGQVQAVDFNQDGPQPPPGPQPFLPQYEQVLTAAPAPPPSGPSLPFSPPQSRPAPAPPAAPAPPPVTAACQRALDQQQDELVQTILKDVGKGAVLGGMAGVTVDGVGALPGLIAGGAIGGIGGVIDWATSAHPLPPECK